MTTKTKEPEHGKLEKMVQYSPEEHITCHDEIAFWQGDGFSTILEFRDKVWVLYVYSAPRQFRMVRYNKSNPEHNQPTSWDYVS